MPREIEDLWLSSATDRAAYDREQAARHRQIAEPAGTMRDDFLAAADRYAELAASLLHSNYPARNDNVTQRPGNREIRPPHRRYAERLFASRRQLRSQSPRTSRSPDRHTVPDR